MHSIIRKQSRHFWFFWEKKKTSIKMTYTYAILFALQES
ncbi:hypothetical protein IB277_14460 [Ensifer sp. ENS07]|nr:hypothetical protein [Ensifer sp. ENS10]MBD9637507.1 hypothetical protein [Ensifer sp. ENS07]